MSAQPTPQPDIVTQMVQDPDFGKMAVSEQRKALAAHDPIFQQAGDDAIGQFVRAHQSPGVGPDDPQGNYDFGDIGKVAGAKMNGRPATRQEAFSQLAQQRGFGQAMGQTLQGKRQDVSNYVQSAVDPDQATKGYLGDLAAMLVGEGASKLGSLRVGEAPIAASARNTLVKKAVLGNTVGRLPGASLLGESFERPTLKDVLKAATQEPNPTFFQQQPNPTFFQQYGQQSHLPVTGPAPTPQAPRAPILTPLDAATAREAGTAARPTLPFLKPSQQPPPQQVTEQPVATAERPPAPESPPVANQTDPKQFYGKTSGKSSLKANQRQLASPTGSTAPNPGPVQEPAGPHPPEIMRILNTPGDMSDADMATVQNYFAKQRLSNLLQKAVGQ